MRHLAPLPSWPWHFDSMVCVLPSISWWNELNLRRRSERIFEPSRSCDVFDNRLSYALALPHEIQIRSGISAVAMIAKPSRAYDQQAPAVASQYDFIRLVKDLSKKSQSMKSHSAKRMGKRSQR